MTPAEGVSVSDDTAARAVVLADPQRLRSLHRACLGAEPDQAFERFAAMVRRLLGVPVALVSLVDADRQFFPGASGLADPWDTKRETPLSHSFCQYVIAEGRGKVYRDARSDPQVRDNLAIPEIGVVAYAGMPLTDAGGRTLGSLCAIDVQPRDWTTDELDILGDLAAACSAELRARIAHDLAEEALAQAGTGRAHCRDHHVAEVLQRQLLTQLPRIPGIDLCARYLPAQSGAAVGGDWYDAFVQPDGSVMLAVGDVCGHDIEAAARMGQLRNVVRGDAYGRADEPGQVLTDVDRAMVGLSMDMAATMLLARLRRIREGYAVTFANAGHPPPVLLRPDGVAEVWWEETEPLLGLLPVEQRTTRRRTAPAGSTLVLYTDGLVEDALLPIDDGLHRLADLVQVNAGMPLPQLCDVLVDAAPRRTDDIAVLVARLAD